MQRDKAAWRQASLSSTTATCLLVPKSHVTRPLAFALKIHKSFAVKVGLARRIWGVLMEFRHGQRTEVAEKTLKHFMRMKLEKTRLFERKFRT